MIFNGTIVIRHLHFTVVYIIIVHVFVHYFKKNYRWLTSSLLGEVVDLLEERKINLVTVRRVLEEMALGSSYHPYQIVEMNDWFQISDLEKIRKLCEDAIRQNPDVVQKYKAGKKKLFFALLGYISETTNQKADMKLITDQLQKLLQKRSD